MIGGSVTVADDETVTGDGLARAWFDAFVASFASTLPPVPTHDEARDGLRAERKQAADRNPSTTPYVEPTEADITARIQGAKTRRLQALRGWTSLPNLLAPPTVAYIQANAVVDLAAVVATVSSQQVGRTPNPNNANTAIQAPSSPVTLPVTNGAATTIGVQ